MANSAWTFLNQNDHGFGLCGMSGIMMKPARPQITVMMALMTKSHLLSSQYASDRLIVVDFGTMSSYLQPERPYLP